jgi:UPF0755 protein
MIKKALFFTFIVGPFLALLMVAAHVSFVFNQTYDGPEVSFKVHVGDTFGKVNQRLYDMNLIPNTRIFHYYAQFLGNMGKLRAGNFTIPQGSKLHHVMNILMNGQPNLISVTIPEGKNMYQIAKIFAQAGITSEKEFLEAVVDQELIDLIKTKAPSLEGYLYPETYRFAANTPGKVVAKTMFELFQKMTEELNFNHPFLNRHQIVVLASVVEKETGAKIERPTIAGVFTNRLKKRMRLESDPTTIYGMWHRYEGNIRKADLRELTPYNTYKIPSLPLGPIANPSLEAIKAVLKPEKNDYLFFVSKNDGTHVFTNSYAEHLKAVQEFQRNPKAREGKSWRDLKQ